MLSLHWTLLNPWKRNGKIDSQTLPDTYRQQFVELRGKMHFLSQSLGESITLAKESLIFLGEKVDKRYMLVFQNNTEKEVPVALLVVLH